MAPPRKRVARYKIRAFNQDFWVEGYPLPNSSRYVPVLEVGDKVTIKLAGWTPMGADETPETDPMTPADAKPLTDILTFSASEAFYRLRSIMDDCGLSYDAKKLERDVVTGVVSKAATCPGDTWAEREACLSTRLGM